MVDYTEIRDGRIRTEICRLMSEMLDNPNEHGIYPTSKFMWEMETFILKENGMKREEYETQLKVLYGKVIKIEDFRLAFEILEAGRAMGLEGISGKEED